MNVATFIGLDPGTQGGAACIDEVGNVYSTLKFEGITTRDLWDWFRDHALNVTPKLAAIYLEEVHSSPDMGVSSAFTFGAGFGRLDAWSIAIGALYNVRYEGVSPQRWQKAIGLISSGRTLKTGRTEKKNKHKAKAQQLFPSVKVTHAIADALLIAEYARKTEQGQSCS